MEQAFVSKPNEVTPHRLQQSSHQYRPPSFLSDDRSTPGGVALPYNASSKSRRGDGAGQMSRARGNPLQVDTHNLGNRSGLPDPFVDLSARMGHVNVSSSGSTQQQSAPTIGYAMSSPPQNYNSGPNTGRPGSSTGSGHSSVHQVSGSGTPMNQSSAHQSSDASAISQSSRGQPLSEQYRSRARTLAAAILSGACENQNVSPATMQASPFERPRAMQVVSPFGNIPPQMPLQQPHHLHREQALPQYVPASTPPTRDDPGLDWLRSPERGVPTFRDYASKLPFYNLCNDAHPTNWGVIKVSEVGFHTHISLLPSLTVFADTLQHSTSGNCCPVWP